MGEKSKEIQVLEASRAGLQAIFTKYSAYWTSNDAREFDRFWLSLSHIERKVQSIESKEKVNFG